MVTSIDLTVVYSLGAVFLGNGSLVVNFLNDSLVDNEYWLCEIHIIDRAELAYQERLYIALED